MGISILCCRSWWTGELSLEPALDSFAHTLSELERACKIMSGHQGTIHLSW
jgi:hypothetical protein